MITDVYFEPTEKPSDDGTICFYATDGVTPVLAGKFPPNELPEVTKKLLHKELSAAEALCDQNIKDWLSKEMKNMGMI